MATIKHISSKNADYSAAEKYLMFEHDEHTQKAKTDSAGRLIPREDIRFTTIGCREDDYAVACIRANRQYGKNNKPQDIKSHHYIISFDPRDRDDHGLTVDKAQEQDFGKKADEPHMKKYVAGLCVQCLTGKRNGWYDGYDITNYGITHLT